MTNSLIELFKWIEERKNFENHFQKLTWFSDFKVCLFNCFFHLFLQGVEFNLLPDEGSPRFVDELTSAVSCVTLSDRPTLTISLKLKS